MSWPIHHSKSQEFASQAEASFRKGDIENALKYFCMAAEEEELALSFLDNSKKRTIGITAISTCSLYFKTNDYDKAEKIAYKYLSGDILPEFAINQLQTILQRIWYDKASQKLGLKFVKGEVLVSISGGTIVPGGAPLDLIIRKVDEIKNFFYRIVEMTLNQPFRKKGSPSIEIQDNFRPWLLQAAPGSYQFAVRIEKPSQLSLFPDFMPKVEEVTQNFLDVVAASGIKDQEYIERIVPDKDYRESFLKLSRNLAPTGKSFNRLEIKSSTDLESPIIFLPESRKTINDNLKVYKIKIAKDEFISEKQFIGVLRGLQLDSDWIEINIPEENKTIRIHQTGEVIDDIVGPMVNHRVIVDVAIKSDGKYFFRDIQSEE